MNRSLFWLLSVAFLAFLGTYAAGQENGPVATAWGKPVDGLQAGLRYPREKTVIRPGEDYQIEIIVRNVTDSPIEFSYLPASQYWGTPEKETVKITAMYLGKGFPNTTHIHPEKELSIGFLLLGHVRPKSKTTSYSNRPELAPGKYQVGAENVVVWPMQGKKEWKLGTGYLEVELVEGK